LDQFLRCFPRNDLGGFTKGGYISTGIFHFGFESVSFFNRLMDQFDKTGGIKINVG